MRTSQEQIEATAQLDRARASLGQALGQTQDITNSGLDVEQISQSLAGAVKCIFTVQHEGLAVPQSSGQLHQSMDHLRQTLRLLQDVQAQDPSLATITSTIARILALIYPVSKLLENMPPPPEPVPEPDATAPDAIELTDEMSKPAMTSETPIPLVPKPGPAPEPRPVEKPLPSEVPEVQKKKSIVPEGRERRHSDRYILKVDIGIQSETNFFTGFSQDISSGGLFIATYDILSMGTPMNVNFNLPRGPVLSLDGTVCWIREYNETTPDIFPGMGVRFENLSGGDEKAINHFIAKNPPIFYDAD
jgi:uncharacterized protein (TIGR02266 family)